MSSSRRMSIGGRSSVLRDSSSLHNSRSSSRRMSIGGADNGFRTETPKKERLAMLDDWRRSARSRETGSSYDNESTTSKRARIHNNEAPPLPHNSQTQSASLPVTSEATTAVERFRMRKQLKLQQQQQQLQQQQNYHNDDNGSTLSSIYYDDSDETSVYSGNLLKSQTPSSSSRFVGGARRRSMSIQPGRTSTSLLLPSSQETFQTHQSLSQLSTDELQDPPTVGTVEGAGLRSRLREMQQRVEQLEKEKMALSISKAPLEARMQIQEDTWIKDRNRLLQEIESLKQAGRHSDERYRDLEVKYEALEENCKRLQLEIRKASSTVHATKPTDGSSWSMQLQNDRDVEELEEKVRNAEDEIRSIRLTKVSVEKELHATKIELESILRSYDELQQEYEEVSKTTSDDREAIIKLDVLTTEHIATSAQLNAVCSDLAATKARAEATIEAKEEEHKKILEQLHFDMSVLKTRAGKVDDSEMCTEGEDEEEDEAILRARIEERDRRIAELEADALKSDEIRRQLHNRIQELRGNIRVFVRTRPFLPSDGGATESAIDVSPDGESLEIADNRNSAPHEFKFDKVFPPSSGQDGVFQEVADFVQSALDGYNVCLFSYGQTGSGKTHTMQGSGNGAMRGIIPRAVEQILEQSKKMHAQKWEFKLSASFLEIYNEDLRDLLVAMNKEKAPLRGHGAKLSIKRSREGKSFVDGLSEISIETNDTATGMQQLEALMKVAARARSVASTKMNAQSSRSHSVFMLHLRGTNLETGAEVHGALNLCDLAGSERLDRSGAGSDKQRLKETQAINKSLSCLGDVFNALAQGSSHIPYRNSKLTYLLQDCLSGDGKALMFVNLSPTTASSNESLCSLRFAQRVNQVELGKPTKNINYNKRMH